MRDIVVFSGSAHRDHAARICAELSVDLSPAVITRWPALRSALATSVRKARSSSTTRIVARDSASSRGIGNHL